MKNALVFCAIAQKDGFQGTVNLSKTNAGLRTYLINAFVCLKSIQLQNPNVEVAVISNIHLDKADAEDFEKEGIKVFHAPFDTFVFPNTNRWALAFYKLASLNWAIANTQYEKFVQLDCDVVCNGSLSDMLEEANHSLIMLSSPLTYNHPMRIQFEAAFSKTFHKDQKRLGKWGSGLIAANRKDMTAFMKTCLWIYEQMVINEFGGDDLLGDEFITSAAVEYAPCPITDGKPYMDVYWTGDFYLVSTNYHFDKMALLHLPAEKGNGILSLYSYFKKHRHFPREPKYHRMLNLPSYKRSLTVKISDFFRKIVLVLSRKKSIY